jgi:hypothetical protein
MSTTMKSKRNPIRIKPVLTWVKVQRMEGGRACSTEHRGLSYRLRSSTKRGEIHATLLSQAEFIGGSHWVVEKRRCFQAPHHHLSDLQSWAESLILTELERLALATKET